MLETCLICRKPLVRSSRPGRPADYCSARCSKRMERSRAQWDRRAAACAEDGFFAINRDDPDHTEAQRQHWQQLLNTASGAWPEASRTRARERHQTPTPPYGPKSA